ncbi:asparaginase [Aliiroseovarius sediminis]|uniref:asparaginase n=1 Tax=Aliiroseovarius sediminis TaxID=2925839 RepID=UPI001F57BA1B|nr:asparaginase [Aliiroseovarius sediminis]MCI2395370.1 asparaginase [Aliiroseovarius sediminis]
MGQSERLVEVWRGDILESQHCGHAVVCNAKGEIVEGWGDPDQVILPRSSAKMLQALPLVESGAADAAGLSSEQLALSCASHQGAAIHTERVTRWLADMNLGNDDLLCGPQMPADSDAKNGLIKTDQSPCRIHNNCSGKHAGFLTLSRHLGAGANYVDLDHPVQKAIKAAFEEITRENSPGYGVDGCSAPNFASTLAGMGRAMGTFAGAKSEGSRRQTAIVRLREAMMLHPELVAGETRACTELMRAAPGKIAVKTGAEAFFVAILPEQELGVALKVTDGATRASECAIATILVRLGVLDAGDPMVKKRMNPVVKNFAGLDTGEIRPSEVLLKG